MSFHTYPTIESWVASAAIPFSLNAPESLNAAVNALAGALDPSVELLGFGEALHGGEEILLLRNRLFARLAEAHGFSAIAFESSFPRARFANEYVAGHGPASYEAVQEVGWSHGFGRIAANRELVEWMRAYNADPAHGVALRCYGFDGPLEMMGAESPRQLLGHALDFLSSVDPAAGEAFRRRIEALLGAESDWQNPAAMFDPALSVGDSANATALRIEAEELIAVLQVRRPGLVAATGPEPLADALHNLAQARQLLNYHAAVARPAPNRTAWLLGIRDALMADNLAYIVDRERGRGKVLVFAHNSHLQRSPARWQLGPELLTWWPAGAHIHALLGPRYALVGTAVGCSEQNGIGQPEPGTLEARLAAAPGPARLIPTFRGQGLPAHEIASLPMRAAGAINTSYTTPLGPQSFADFDWLAMLDSVGYARGAPPLQR